MMTGKRLKEITAMMMIGEGLLAVLIPSRHAHLWKFGPAAYQRAVDYFEDHPNTTRLLGAGEIGLGLWMALRQTS